jgi:TPR repeat protein
MKTRTAPSLPARAASASPDPCSRAQKLALDNRYPEGLDLLRGLAERGDRDAQRTLGELLFHGDPAHSDLVNRNRVEAGQWFNRAAAQGCPVSRYYLDWFYGNEGDGATGTRYECLTIDYS